MNENNKDALIASLKRKNKKLEEENRQLREQLKVAYADVYKNLYERITFTLLQLTEQYSARRS